MISVFDIQKLRGFLRDFYALTQIRIMVYDDQFRELCAYPEERSPSANRYGKICGRMMPAAPVTVRPARRPPG